MTNIVRVHKNFMVRKEILNVTLFLRFDQIKKVSHNGTWSMLYLIFCPVQHTGICTRVKKAYILDDRDISWFT